MGITICTGVESLALASWAQEIMICGQDSKISSDHDSLRCMTALTSTSLWDDGVASGTYPAFLSALGSTLHASRGEIEKPMIEGEGGCSRDEVTGMGFESVS